MQLHIGADQTVLTDSATQPATVLNLAIGSRKTATEFFHHAPPTPGAMENAIQFVEDEVMRAGALIPDGVSWVTTDPAIRQIALLAGVAEGAKMWLELDALERVFNRLAMVTLGSPATQQGVPTDAGFAATLLILRECMHHLKMAAISIEIGL